MLRHSQHPELCRISATHTAVTFSAALYNGGGKECKTPRDVRTDTGVLVGGVLD